MKPGAAMAAEMAAARTGVLESAAAASSTDDRCPNAFEGDSDIFLYPGCNFNVVDAMITNFHLPRSTLLMLVAALTGQTRLKQAYAEAIRQNYRFFSYGDAMLIL